MLKIFSLVGLLLYFVVLMMAVAREKKNESVLDFFFAGKTLPFWALSLTFIASWWGAGSALSTADLAYEDGLGAFWYYGVPVLLATLCMMMGAKRIRNIGYLTQGIMMEKRYSKSVASMVSWLIFIFMTLTASSQMVGIGDFAGTYLGLDYEMSVLLGTLVVLVYSLFGGFRGVVLTDIIQFVLLLLSALIVFVVAMHQAGGWANIALAAEHAGKGNYMSFGAGASKYLMYVVTFGLAWSIQANVWQRISACRDAHDAQRMTWMSFFVFIPLYLIIVLTGMAGLVLYEELPQGGVVAALVSQAMPELLAAFVFIGITAAIMSTLDSLINTAAMTMVLDLDPKRETRSELGKLRLSRYATLFVTLIALLFALKVRSILEISWMAADLITTGVFVPLILGFCWRRGNNYGALCSMIVGSLYCFYNLLIYFDCPLPSCWPAQSAAQVLIGVAFSLVSYVGVSLLTKPQLEKACDFISKSQ